MPNKINPTEHKLIGKNYTTPDLSRRSPGKRQVRRRLSRRRHAVRKLLLSPMPHARDRSIDTQRSAGDAGREGDPHRGRSAGAGRRLTDNGAVIRANKLGERGLTDEPVYQGEPILAVRAVDELTGAEAIEKIKIDYERLPFVVDPLVSLRPGGPNARVEGNVWMRPAAPPNADKGKGKGGRGGGGFAPPEVVELKWTEADFADAKDGKLPMGKPTDRVVLRRSGRGVQERRPGSG